MAELDITFADGLVEVEEPSELGIGSAPTLTNWSPEPSGGLRCRVGWLNTGTGGDAPTTRRATGIGYSAVATNRFIVALNTNPDSEVQVQTIDRDDLTGDWTERDTITVANGSGKHVSFDTGLAHTYYTSPAFSGVRSWDGSGSGAAVSGSPSGSRAVAFHVQRIWAGDGTNLVSSALADGQTWPGVTIAVGATDGEPIECLLEVGDDLIIGKENTLWDLSGSGVNSFALHKIPGPCGVAPGQTLVNTPYGVVIIGRENVWLWDQGGAPQRISKPIEQSYGLTGRYMSGCFIDGRCYIVDEGRSDYWVYDAADQKWYMESIDGNGNEPTNVFALGDTLLMGVSASETVSNLAYRNLPAQPDTRTKDFDDLTETYIVETPELWFGEENHRATIFKVNLRLRQRGGESYQAPILLTAFADGVAVASHTIEPTDTVGTYRVRKDFGYDCWSTQFQLSQTVDVGQAACFDIERFKVEFEVSGRR